MAIAGVPFPGAGWTDIAAGFALNWVQAILRLSAGEAEREQVFFMYGPFAVTLAKTNSGTVQVDCIDRHEQKTVLSVDSTIEDLLADAVGAARHVVAQAEAKKWASDGDIRSLSQEVNA